jgi:hypothetical protein
VVAAGATTAASERAYCCEGEGPRRRVLVPLLLRPPDHACDAPYISIEEAESAVLGHYASLRGRLRGACAARRSVRLLQSISPSD